MLNERIPICLGAVAATAVLLVGCSSSSPTGGQPSADSSAPQEASAPAPPGATNHLVRDFLAARVAGQGAERYLGVPEKTIPLLYATSSGAPYERAEFNRVRGIEWPYGYSAFRVRLFAAGTVVEQLFFKPPDGPRGLVYEPDGFATHIAPTTENGQAVAVPYTAAAGEVTVEVPHPWVAWDNQISGRLGGIRMIPQASDTPPTTDAGERNGWDDVVFMADPTLYGTCWRAGVRPGNAEALARAIRSEAVWATAPAAVRVGGADALMLDVVIPAEASVPFCPHHESGILSIVVNPDGRGMWYGNGREAGYATGERMRLYLFDAPERSSIRVLAVAITAPESRFKSVVEAASPIVDSIRFQAGLKAAVPVIRAGEEWIAFTGVSPGITLIRADGTDRHVILGERGQESFVDWSPDGSKLAYMQGGSPRITDVRGKNRAWLIKSVPPDLKGLSWWGPAWSPDGSEVVVVGGSGSFKHPFRAVLAIADVATGKLTRLGELATGRLYRSPRWSPDGQAIVFTADRYSCNNGCDLYGGSAVAVVRRRGDTWSAPKAITDVGLYGSADWHPTKDLILFGDRDIRGDIPGTKGSDYPPTRLYTMSSDGGQRTTLRSFRSDERPSGGAWTPDGRIIATLVTVAGQRRGIALLNADGSGMKVVVPGRAGGGRMRPR